MAKKIGISLAVGYFLIAAIGACTPHREQIPSDIEPDPIKRYESAVKQANKEGGKIYLVANTRSMEPVLFGGDYIIIKKVPFEEIKVGDMALYLPSDTPNDEPPYVHWVAERSGSGWIMDGQANRHYDRKIMTKDNYVGKVTFIFSSR